MHEPDRFAHRGNAYACDRADDHGQHDNARFPRPDDGTQTVRDFQMTAEYAHCEQDNQAGDVTVIKAMAAAGASEGFNAPKAASIVAPRRFF